MRHGFVASAMQPLRLHLGRRVAAVPTTLSLAGMTLLPESLLRPINDPCHICRAGSRRHVQSLNALAEVARTLARTGSQEDILREILRVLEERLDMRRATVMLLSPDGSELFVEALRSSETHPSDDARYRRGEGILGRVIETGKSLIIPSIEEEPRFQDRVHQRKDAQHRRQGLELRRLAGHHWTGKRRDAVGRPAEAGHRSVARRGKGAEHRGGFDRQRHQAPSGNACRNRRARRPTQAVAVRIAVVVAAGKHGRRLRAHAAWSTSGSGKSPRRTRRCSSAANPARAKSWWPPRFTTSAVARARPS